MCVRKVYVPPLNRMTSGRNGGLKMLYSTLMLMMSSAFLMLRLSPGGSFPRPLSEAEERRYLEAWLQGDLEARNVLIERNLRLVAHIIKKYYTHYDDTDDLISIGTIGLIKGIDSFTPGKKTRLSTYAAKCIHNEILMVLRAKKHSVPEVSLSEAIGSDKEGNEVTLMDIIPSDSDNVEDNYENRAEIKKMYDGIKNVLEPRERKIISMRYGLYDGKEIPQREIAKMLGISRSYVSRIEKKAVEKLRSSMK